MKIIKIDYQKHVKLPPAIACAGFFDGVHIGHQELIRTALKRSGELGLPVSIITFDPDPVEVFAGKQKNLHINDLENRLELFEHYGADYAYVIHFTLELSQLSPEGFIEFLNRLNISHLVCGFDFSFGFRGEGNTGTLLGSTKRKFSVDVVEAIKLNNEKVSSSRIIENISRGHINKAVELLGHQLIVSGSIRNNVFSSRCCVLPENARCLIRFKGRKMDVEIRDRSFELIEEDQEKAQVELISNY